MKIDSISNIKLKEGRNFGDSGLIHQVNLLELYKLVIDRPSPSHFIFQEKILVYHDNIHRVFITTG